MNWQNLKNGKAPPEISGVRTRIERVDGAVKSITFLDANGAPLFRVASPYSALELSVPELVERHVLSGKVIDLSVNETFDTAAEAEDRKNQLVGVAATVSGTHDLTVTAVNVPAGAARGEVADEIPF